MPTPRCPSCGAFSFLDAMVCTTCQAEIGYHYPSLQFVEVVDDVADVDGQVWQRCLNKDWRCNWMVDAAAESTMCFACRLTRRRPQADDVLALERLADAGVAKRRLLIQLFGLDLPVTPYWEKDGGLAFDLLSSLSGESVVIGHASGIITIDLAETLDDRRERLRIRLGEPYRTMLGHFRHEIGHYYQSVLVAGTAWEPECRELFGDERVSYAEALKRHYEYGAPPGWENDFISAYATMHPWEDFAETFAHYLHITATLETAEHAGVIMQADRATGLNRDIWPLADYREEPGSRMLDDWRWLSLMFNRVNRTMGQRDLYPFEITEPIARKIDFVHRVIVSATTDRLRPIGA